MTLIWYINPVLDTRTSVPYLKLHCSLESVDWKDFVIFRLQLIFGDLYLPITLENKVWNCYFY